MSQNHVNFSELIKSIIPNEQHYYAIQNNIKNIN